MCFWTLSDLGDRKRLCQDYLYTAQSLTGATAARKMAKVRWDLHPSMNEMSVLLYAVNAVCLDFLGPIIP